jgi:hypothetical protein
MLPAVIPGGNMRFKRLARRLTWSGAAFVAVAVAMPLAKPPALPASTIHSRLSSGTASSVTNYLQLNGADYGALAASFGKTDCSRSGDGSSTGTRYDEWLFDTPSTNKVVIFQVLFRDKSAGGAIRQYTISSNGTSVTSTPGPSGTISFDQDYSRISVKTPNAGQYEVLRADDAALKSSPSAAYDKTIYSRSAESFDKDKAVFKLASTCHNHPEPPRGGCHYPDGDSKIETPTVFGSTPLKGKLTCCGKGAGGHKIKVVGDGKEREVTTDSDGSFVVDKLPNSGSITLSFPGTATVPKAPPVTLKHS